MNPADPLVERSDLSAPTESEAQPAATGNLWETILSRENLIAALQRVERNRGAPGVDGTTVDDIRPWLKGHWRETRRRLDEGTYRPSPVRRVTIPKPDGGERELGVPTVLDRVIQQAIEACLDLRSVAPSEACLMNRRMRGPHVRWCGRGRVNPGPYPMCARHGQSLGGVSPPETR